MATNVRPTMPLIPRILRSATDEEAAEIIIPKKYEFSYNEKAVKRNRTIVFLTLLSSPLWFKVLMGFFTNIFGVAPSVPQLGFVSENIHMILSWIFG